MDLDAELLLDQLCELARPNGFAGDDLRFEKRQHFAFDLARAMGPRLLRDQPRNSRRVEVRLYVPEAASTSSTVAKAGGQQ